jgi:hypothetical protein
MFSYFQASSDEKLATVMRNALSLLPMPAAAGSLMAVEGAKGCI